MLPKGGWGACLDHTAHYSNNGPLDKSVYFVRSLELYKTENLSKKLEDSSLLFETLIVDGHVD
jgi:hypothetical protein